MIRRLLNGLLCTTLLFLFYAGASQRIYAQVRPCPQIRQDSQGFPGSIFLTTVTEASSLDYQFFLVDATGAMRHVGRAPASYTRVYDPISQRLLLEVNYYLAQNIPATVPSSWTVTLELWSMANAKRQYAYTLPTDYLPFQWLAGDQLIIHDVPQSELFVIDLTSGALMPRNVVARYRTFPDLFTSDGVLFSPNGRYVIYGPAGDDYGLHLWDFQQGREVWRSKQRDDIGINALYAAWTSDSRQIALAQLQQGDMQIVLLDPIRLTETQVSNFPPHVRFSGDAFWTRTNSLLWSPDNRYLAFHHIPHAYLMDAARSQIWDLCGEYYPEFWSPDSQFLVLSEPSGPLTINVLDVTRNTIYQRRMPYRGRVIGWSSASAK